MDLEITTASLQELSGVRAALSVPSVADLDAHIDRATAAHEASAISTTPAGTIAATTVQGALNELDTEKARLVDGFIDETQIPALVIAEILGGTDTQRLATVLAIREPALVVGDTDPYKNGLLYYGDGVTPGGLPVRTLPRIALGDHLVFDSTVTSKRVGVALGTAGDGIGAGGLTYDVLLQVPTSAATKGVCRIDNNITGLDASSSALSVYFHYSDELRVQAGSTSTRRWISYVGVFAKHAGQVVWVHVTWDAVTKPKLYINGQECTTTDSGGSLAWTAAVADDYFVYGNNQAGEMFTGPMRPPTLINAVLTAPEIMHRVVTDRLPDWCEAGVGSMVAQTSGTITIGRRYRIAAFVSGDSFTNVGAASNAAGIEFVATATTPTTWTNSSSIIALGPIVRPVVLPRTLRMVGDGGSNGLCGNIYPASANSVITNFTTRRDWQVVLRSVTDAAENLGASWLFSAANTNRIDTITVSNAGPSATVSIGHSSGGTQYVNGATAGAGLSDHVPDLRFNGGVSVWVDVSAAQKLVYTITGHEVATA